MLKTLAAGLLSASTLIADFDAAESTPDRFEIPTTGLTFWSERNFNSPYINYPTMPAGCTNLPFDAWAGLNAISGDQIRAYTGPDCTGIEFGFSFHAFNYPAKSFRPL
ncbi:hypothetical protein ACN28S_40840 [Cystobacter fuscus]